MPKEAIDQQTTREGDLAELDVRKAKRDWFGTTKGVGPFSKEDELDTQ